MDPKYNPQFINEKAKKEFDVFLADQPSLKSDVEYVYELGVPDRSKTYLMFEGARALGVDKNKLIPFAIGAELMMAAAMNDDDIIDDNGERFGKPALWKIKGINPTIMVTGYMYSLIFSIIKKYRPALDDKDFAAYQKAENVLVEYFRVMHIAQYRTTVSAKELADFTLEDLEQLAVQKASLLFKYCTATPAYFANKFVDELENFGYWTGVARQYRSDVRDFLEVPTDNYKKGVRMEDYFTHQPNLILVLAGKSDRLTNEERKWFYDNWSNPVSEQDKKMVTDKVVELIAKTNAIELGLTELKKINEKLQSYIKDLPDEDVKKNLSKWALTSCLME